LQSTKEAAARLDISYHTADGYIRDIYEKLQVNTRSGVVAKALKEGLV
jgi:DNA-binding CsgD family transcriptional regulator